MTQPRPLSLLVWGNSCVFMQVPVRSSTDDQSYGEVVRDRLAESGVPSTLRVEARWFDFLTRAIRRYEHEVRPHAPEVVVVHFGVNETQPWLLPVWTIRHLLARDRAVTRPTKAYRQHVATRLWRISRRYRRWAAPLVGMRTWQTTPQRFDGTLRRALLMLRYEWRPLVLVMDVAPPAGPLLRTFPDMPARVAQFNEIIAKAVADAADPDVRFIDTRGIVEELGVESSLPDGQHFSPEAHRRVGELLVQHVGEWIARERPELAARS